MAIIHLYIDESGARHPDRQPKEGWNAPCHWFALGGVLIDADDENTARESLSAFRARWPQIGGTPLHSYEIRNKREGFQWLETAQPDERRRFMEDLSDVITGLPILGVACVIDGPGYNARYADYADRRWKLCKTAASIVIERATKYAMDRDARLRIYLERSDQRTEQDIRDYYEALRAEGDPFDKVRAADYAPLTAEDYRGTLLEFRTKYKSSPLMQVADLVLWPMCKGGYDDSYGPYVRLKRGGRLIDCQYPEAASTRGTKYSCFALWREQHRA